MKSKHIVLVLTLSLGLVQAVAQPQGPDPGNRPSGPNLAGTVSAVGKDSLTVTPFNGGSAVTVKVSDATRVMKNRQPASLSEIKAGDDVFARGTLKDNVLDARIVSLIPPEMAKEMAEREKQGGGRMFVMAGPGGQGAFSPEDLGKKFIAGEIKAINETRLTIARPDGQSQDIEVDENTSFKRGNESITLPEIKVGDFVRGPGELKNNVFIPKELRVGRGDLSTIIGGPRPPRGMFPQVDSPPDKSPSAAPPKN